MRWQWGEAPPGVYAGALQVALVAFVVGGSLLNMAYFDLLYHIIALTVVLEIVAPEAGETSAVTGTSKNEEPWWKQPKPQLAAFSGDTRWP